MPWFTADSDRVGGSQRFGVRAGAPILLLCNRTSTTDPPQKEPVGMRSIRNLSHVHGVPVQEVEASCLYLHISAAFAGVFFTVD